MSQESGAPRSSQPSIRSDKKSSPTAGLRTLPPIQTKYNEPPKSFLETAGQARAQVENVGRSTPTTSNMHLNAPFKTIGMQNILNPSGRDKTSNPHNFETTDVPSSSSANTPHTSATSLSQSPSNHSLPSITPPISVAYPSLVYPGPRRILTPRAPSLFSASNITRNNPSATIDAKRSPFVSSSDRRTVSGPGGTALPDVPSGPVSGYHYNGFPQQPLRSPPVAKPGAFGVHPGSAGERRMSGSVPQPQSARSDSPTTSYSSYSRFSQTPPVPPVNVPSGQPTSYFTSYNASGPNPTFQLKDPYGPSSGGSGPGAYPSMAMDTEQGTIPVPVDILAASKVADEKRRRNATASHRFRQRRKEKERETSQNIAKLEHQIRDIAEERDFYRMERDYFRSIACSGSNANQIGPRPPSPRQVRLAQRGKPSVRASTQWQGHEESSGQGRNTRRRTSNFTPTTAVVPQNINQAPQPSALQDPAMQSERPVERFRGPQGHSPPGPSSIAQGQFGPNTLHPGYHRDWKGPQGPKNM